jgi:type II secretory pathway pseudopilin PulG
LEVMVAAALSALAALIFLAFLTSGYNFVLATESFGVQAASARNALDRMVRLGSTATSHQVYASYAAYTTGTPVSPPGTPGACLRLVTPTGNWVFWRDSATSELRYLQEGTARRGVLARGITDFQARCLFADQVQVTLTATTASASDINTTLTVTSSVYHRNGTTGPCTLGPLRRRPA